MLIDNIDTDIVFFRDIPFPSRICFFVLKLPHVCSPIQLHYLRRITLDYHARRFAEITIRWTSEVPSYISVIFASLNKRSTVYSFVYPYPPCICTALITAFMAVSA